jgi:putative SOS response-associated peptidase YedK
MPVMLMAEDCDRWFGPTMSIDAYAVNRAVNSVKNDTEACIEPVTD